MFQRILVPLDGSERAELALPVAVRLARATGGSLLLLRVVTLPADRVWYALEPPFRTEELLVKETRTASTYLANRAWGLELAGITVQTSIMAGLPVLQLLSCIETQAVDLVVMCSRGESRSHRRVVGSVAQHVLRQSSVPVLVLQEASGQRGMLHPQEARPIHILVPLDGSEDAEAVLAPAAFLAAALSAPQSGMLHLVHVLPSLSCADATETTRQQAREEALAYLRMISQMVPTDALGQLKLSIRTSVFLHPDAASAIVRAAEQGQAAEGADEVGSACDAIALTTYGSSQPGREGVSCVVERLLQDTCLPVLVVPPICNERKEPGAFADRQRG